MTQDQVARAVGTNKGYVSMIESGRVQPPSPKFIAKFARLYSVDEKELLRLAYAEKAPRLIREEIIRALWP
jgi:transcriptional regulator with XRE-family HTH domain